MPDLNPRVTGSNCVGSAALAICLYDREDEDEEPQKEAPVRVGTKRKSCGDAEPAKKSTQARKRVLRRATGALVKVTAHPRILKLFFHAQPIHPSCFLWRNGGHTLGEISLNSGC
jgi:hypothetical protein